MSGAMIKEGIRDFLRSENGWNQNQCEVQTDGQPPSIARNFYVAIGSITVRTRALTQHFLGEQFTLTVSIWWETANTPADMSGNAQLRQVLHQTAVTTLEDLERLVIRQLHNVQEPRNAVNGQFSLPGANGDQFLLPFNYDGRGDDERINPNAGSRTSSQWLGRRLPFTGFDRNQKIGSVR